MGRAQLGPTRPLTVTLTDASTPLAAAPFPHISPSLLPSLLPPLVIVTPFLVCKSRLYACLPSIHVFPVHTS